MTRDDFFDETVSNDEIDGAYAECQKVGWKIRNNHTGKESNDFYNGQMAAYRNVMALCMHHPKANDPDFVITVCNQLRADVAMILGPRPRRLIGGPPNNNITFPG